MSFGRDLLLEIIDAAERDPAIAERVRRMLGVQHVEEAKEPVGQLPAGRRICAPNLARRAHGLGVDIGRGSRPSVAARRAESTSRAPTNGCGAGASG